ncbi:MAG: lytic transglycosylase domain-containing protein, partial [Burkholderiales bacterium]
MTSRAALRRFCLALVLLAPLPVLAGTQLYEPLADSVRATLSAAVSDRPPPTLNFRRPEDAHRWLFEMSRRLAKRVPDRAVRLQ